MADKEISALTSASAADGTELVHIVQGGNSRKATISGINSVVLADVDLAVTDIRLAGTPVVITGIDVFNELAVDFYSTFGSNGEMAAHLSTDNGSTWIDSAGSYNAGWSDHTNAGIIGALGAIAPITRNGTTSAANIRIRQMGNANARTCWMAITTSNLGHWAANGFRTAEEVNNAIRFYSDQAPTGGRLVVTGIF